MKTNSTEEAIGILMDEKTDRLHTQRYIADFKTKKEIVAELYGNAYSFEDLLDSFNERSRQELFRFVRQLEEAKYIAKIETPDGSKYCLSDGIEMAIRKLKNMTEFDPIEGIIKNFDDAHKLEDIPNQPEQIKNDKKLLTDYLKNISRLETNIFELTKRYNYLETKNLDVTIDASKTAVLPSRVHKEFQSTLVEPVEPQKPSGEPIKPVLEKPGLFNKKKIEEENQKKMEAYNTSLEEYNKALEEYQLKIKAYNDEKQRYLITLEEEKKRFIDFQNKEIKEAEERVDLKIKEGQKAVEQEINLLKNELEQTIKTRNELYSLGIIYGKYRNIVAVSTFCDYLMSGRCSQLDGPDGAYNIYEQETRADIVINKLDAALNSLERIQENQYYLYQQLQDAISDLDLINGQLLVNNALELAQLDKLDEIASSSKVGAFYAKKNAELTNALGFLVALK